MFPINVIGIGQGKKDLTQVHLDLIENCDILVGGSRQLSLFDYPDKQKIIIKGHIKRIVESIKDKMAEKKIVVLASGDPLFYGIGSTLVQHIKKEHVIIHSNISSISAAFAAIREPWHDAKIVSLHGKKQKPFEFSKLTHENKIAFLTDPQMDPKYIALGLIEESLFEFRFCVLENLGDEKNEKISWFDNLNHVSRHDFSHPNIVILQKRGKDKTTFSQETHIGMEDTLFKHSKGLITKSEIRSITLSKLKFIKKDHVLWDIGSGSGSLGIEAALQLPWGHVYAIEKRPDRISDIIHNIKNFNCSNVKVLNAVFPKGIEDLKTPDRIFIGGGGKQLDQIIKKACDKLACFGIIVINTVLIQNLEASVRVLKELKFNPDVVQVQVARSKGMPFGDRFEALNPVWIISGSKP